MAEPVGYLRLRITPGSIARATLLVAGWMVVVAVLTRARGSLVLFALGMTGAALALPLVAFLGRWIPRWVAVVAVSLLAAAVVGLVGYRAVDEVDRQTDKLADAIDESVERIEASPRYADLAERLDLKDRADQVTTTLREDVSLNADRLGELAPELASEAGDVFIVWLFSVMLLAGGPPMVDAFVRLFPSPVTQARMHRVIVLAHRRMARYVGLMMVRAVAVFLLTYGLGLLLDLRVPTVLALAVAFLSLFPCVGLLVGGILFAVSTALRSPDLVIPLILAAVLLQACDVVFVQRRIEAWSVAVRSFLLVVATMLGWSLEGVRGVIIATVAVIFVMAAIEEGLAIRDGTKPDPGSGIDGNARRGSGATSSSSLPALTE
ncbi:MAG TPA: AI-2E family transporter [Acidimicrobiales bacterium]